MIEQPFAFYSKPPGAWQLGFWGAWIGLSLLLAAGWWSEPFTSGRLIVALGLAGCFFGFFIATWRRRQRDIKPAVIISSDGLRFRPETTAERFVRWDQLKAAIDDRRGSLVFSTTDNRKLGGRALLLFPTGIYVSSKCQTRDGVKLVSRFPALWQEMMAASNP